MTNPVKIHRQDPDKRKGTSVCGREATSERITSTPARVTCVVCRTFSPEAAQGSRETPPTVLDRLIEDEILDDVARVEGEEIARVRSRAKIRALSRLASSNLDEFRKVFRAELAAAITEEEDLEISV